jgi:hypothetical protein
MSIKSAIIALIKIIKIVRLDQKLKSTTDDFANEYQTIYDIIKKIGIYPQGKKEGEVVDIAAGDGYSQSCTQGFFRLGFQGLAVEMDSNKFSTLSFLYRKFPNVRLIKARVTPLNVASILSAAEIKKNFAILNLDIDSYDLHVIDAILQAGYLPTVISMEINEKIPSGIHFSVNFDPSHYWQFDHFYGCSIDAAYNAIIPYGYMLYKIEYNNAFFIKSSDAISTWKHLSAAEAYDEGYRKKINRKELFPWNSDVDYWQDLNNKQVIKKIKTKFSSYSGKFAVFETKK